MVEANALEQFASKADSRAFEEHFSKRESPYVTVFDNLGKTATLVAPKPIRSDRISTPPTMYGHLASYCRNASTQQIQSLWKTVATTYLIKLQQPNEDPLWLSTSGTGVAWLHIRFDIQPKYYTYQPFKELSASDNSFLLEGVARHGSSEYQSLSDTLDAGPMEDEADTDMMNVVNPNPEDLLTPPFFSEKRTSSIVVASFNLLATIVGGGVLSLPLVFQKCGILVATLLLVLAAAVTSFSLNILCLSSRRTGATSYGEVARTAFGEWMEYSVSALLLVFLLFVLVAYMILVRDIWTPIVNLGFPDDHKVEPDTVLLGVLVVLSPFLIQHSLYALRFNCYIGFTSVCILCAVLLYHGMADDAQSTSINLDMSLESPPNSHYRIFYWPSLADVLFAFPITMLSFCCHFNIVAIQEALIEPTRRRMSYVVDSSIGAALCLNFLFGLGGYLCAGDGTQGNILLNTPTMEGDWGFLVGRVGVGITILFATPMVLLPCRENLLELVDASCWNVPEEVHEEVVGERTSLVRNEPIQMDIAFQNPWMHYGATFAIALVCYTGAVAAPGVAVVWSLCGCSMGFLISFILPTAFFLRIEKQQIGSRNVSYEKPLWVVQSWIIFIGAFIGALVCTISTASSL